MKKLSILGIILFLAFSCTKQKQKIEAEAIKIDIATFQSKILNNESQLVDVRTSEEYNNGHIKHAINIDISNSDKFHDRIKSLNKEEPIYIYCQKGGRSSKACKTLIENGFTKVYDFSGGWEAWNNQ